MRNTLFKGLCFFSFVLCLQLFASPSTRSAAAVPKREVEDTMSIPITPGPAPQAPATPPPVPTYSAPPPAPSSERIEAPVPPAPTYSAPPSPPPSRVNPSDAVAKPKHVPNTPQQPKVAEPSEAPRRVVSAPVVDPKSDPRVAMAERLADLLVCVPAHKESDYSTQSWYLTDSFMAWNNGAAEGSFSVDPIDPAFRDVFESTAMAKVASRNPELAKDPQLVDYFKNASLAAKEIYAQASQQKTKTDFAQTVALLKASSRMGGKNIFENLKALHNRHASTLKGNACAPLAKRFFESPKFTGSAQALTASPVIKGGRKVSERPEALKKLLAEVDKTNARDAAINQVYPRGDMVTAQLPNVSYANRKTAGYYTAGKYQWARPHIVGNILKAADTLKSQGISMGVGDINAQGTESKKKASTPGYRGRDSGTKATFLLVNPQGEASTCGFESQSCYDPEKSFQMVRALIDSDPENIRRIEISNEALRTRVEDYLVSQHRFKKVSANWVVRSNREFNNAINFEWKK